MKIALVSNVNQDSLVRRLKKQHDIFLPAGYGSWIADLANPQSELLAFDAKAIFVLFDGAELFHAVHLDDTAAIQQQISEVWSYLEHAIETQPKIKFFVSTIDIPSQFLKSVKASRSEKMIEARWLDQLSAMNQKHKNMYVFDLKEAITQEGRKTFYSAKLWYLGGIKYSALGEKILEKQLNRCIRAIEGKRQKALLLDCDNTLWGGVLGEEGIDGIELAEKSAGTRFKDFQKRILDVKNLGAVLTIVSKNNEADILEVLAKHSHMVLKSTDFVAKKINWSIKSQNISELADELNIGIDSLVFIDDNPVERASVSEALPKLVVPTFPQDTAELPAFMEEIYQDYFLVLDPTQEDLQKTALYQGNAERANAERHAASFDSFLVNLQTKIKLYRARPEDLSRVAQLTQKTNQFNVTTTRYTEAEIQGFMQSESHEVYLAEIDDRFGENGKVFVAIAKHLPEQKIQIETLLMSCRVMGRLAEDHLLHALQQIWRRAGLKTLSAQFRATEKNHPVRDLFPRLGFTLIESDAEQASYSLDLTKADSEVKTFHSQLELIQ